MKCFAHTRNGRFELRRPETETERDCFHSIRERTLWNDIGMSAAFGPYNRDYPDQYREDYTELVLVRNGIVTGTVSLQDMGDHGMGPEIEVRGVAIDPACQGQGYGGVMLMLVDRYASIKGYRRAGVWSDANAVLFYARSGYIHRPADMPVRMECPVAGSIPMTKRLDLGVAQNDGSVLIAAA
jgi:N-acetylglutamate synthase-like GNAT family acetyltransferase